jgi:hypothetical protein
MVRYAGRPASADRRAAIAIRLWRFRRWARQTKRSADDVFDRRRSRQATAPLCRGSHHPASFQEIDDVSYRFAGAVTVTTSGGRRKADIISGSSGMSTNPTEPQRRRPKGISYDILATSSTQLYAGGPLKPLVNIHRRDHPFPVSVDWAKRAGSPMAPGWPNLPEQPNTRSTWRKRIAASLFTPG